MSMGGARGLAPNSGPQTFCIHLLSPLQRQTLILNSFSNDAAVNLACVNLYTPMHFLFNLFFNLEDTKISLRQLSEVVDKAWLNYEAHNIGEIVYPMFSLAASVPFDLNTKKYSIESVMAVDSPRSVRQALLRCNVYPGTRLVEGVVLKYPDALTQCPDQTVPWDYVKNQCPMVNVWRDFQKCDNNRIDILLNSGNNLADHAEYRVLTAFDDSKFDQNMKENDLMLFISRMTPCSARCTNSDSYFNILTLLEKIKKWKNIAFVFANLFEDPERTKQSLTALGEVLGLENVYRCEPNSGFPSQLDGQRLFLQFQVMASLWTVVVLALIFSTRSNDAAVNVGGLPQFVSELLNLYTPMHFLFDYEAHNIGEIVYPMFSLAASVPFDLNTKKYSIESVMAVDSPRSVRQALLRCNVYGGTRLVEAVVLKYPDALTQCPDQTVPWPYVKNQCPMVNVWRDFQTCDNNRIDILLNSGNNLADHAEYRVLTAFDDSKFDQNMKENDLMLFISRMTPCSARCTNSDSYFNILTLLEKIKKWKNIAFVFANLFEDPERTKQSLTALGEIMASLWTVVVLALIFSTRSNDAAVNVGGLPQFVSELLNLYTPMHFLFEPVERHPSDVSWVFPEVFLPVCHAKTSPKGGVQEASETDAQTPQLAPLNMEEQRLYSEFLSHYPKLMTIDHGVSVDSGGFGLIFSTRSNDAAVNVGGLPQFVSELLNLYTPMHFLFDYEAQNIGEIVHPMFSLAASVPFDLNTKKYSIENVMAVDSPRSVRQALLRCNVYPGTRLVEAVCPMVNVWRDFQKCDNNKIDILLNSGNNLADHAEYRVLTAFDDSKSTMKLRFGVSLRGRCANVSAATRSSEM
ncbi:hypothetical protein WMY93_006200 [Mugilogobius chulae]|uniref:Uncharacterized protein n=1 Tax=Mugilogobius chulae TaxID=88201 RepID=A0AAW0PIY9_9GOBI